MLFTKKPHIKGPFVSGQKLKRVPAGSHPKTNLERGRSGSVIIQKPRAQS